MMKLSLSPRIAPHKHFNYSPSPNSLSHRDLTHLPLISSYRSTEVPNTPLGLSYMDAFNVFKAKCKDLKIPSSKEQEQKFIVNFINSVNGRRIDLTGSGLGKQSAEVLTSSLKSDYIYSHIVLSNNNLADEGCEIIGKLLKNNLSIIHLDISGNNLTPEGASTFFSEICENEGLVSLNVSSIDRMNKNRLGTKGSESLGNYLSRTATLLFLNISGTGIGHEGLDLLSIGLSYNSSVVNLSLADNYIEGKHMSLFFSILGRTRVKELNLSGNHVALRGSEILCSFLLGKLDGGCHLTKLDLSRCDLNEEACERLFIGVENNSSLFELIATNNPMGPRSGEYLRKSISTNTMLRYLNISFCKLTEDGMVRFSEALYKNFSLRSLNASNNYICDNGSKALAEAIKKNLGLQSIDLSGNLIRNTGAMCLIESLHKNTRIRSVNLSCNSFKDPIGHELLALVSRCKNLLSLSLELNSLNLKYVKLIKQCLKRNNENLKNTLYPQLQHEIDKMAISDDHIDQVFEQISVKTKEKEEFSRKLVKKQTKFFEVRDEETEKFEQIKDERNQVQLKKFTLAKDHDTTSYEMTKIKYLKEKEMKEIRDQLGTVNQNLLYLERNKKSMMSQFSHKKDEFMKKVSELRIQVQYAESERNKVRSELEELKVNFKLVCDQLIQVKNISAKREQESPIRRKKTTKPKRNN